MKRVKSILLGLTAFALLLCFGGEANAEEYNVYLNDPTVYVGEEVAVEIWISPAITGAEIHYWYDTDILDFAGGEGGLGNCSITNSFILDYSSGSGASEASYTLYFRTKTTGSARVGISEYDFRGADGSDTSRGFRDDGPYSLVEVINPPTASSEARMASLRLVPGSMTPDFDPDQHDYYITVSEDTNTLAIDYEMMDDNAYPYYNDDDIDRVPYGESLFVITCRAEDGTEEYYYITIFRQGEPPTEPPVTEPEPTEPEPTEPEPTTVQYVSREFGLEILPFPEGFKIPAGYKATKMMNGAGTVYSVLTPEGLTDYNHYLLYGQTDSGAVGLYLYDMQEKTLQRYDFAVKKEPTKPAETESTAESTAESTEESTAESSEQTTEEPTEEPTKASSTAAVTSSAEESSPVIPTENLPGTTESGRFDPFGDFSVPGWLVLMIGALLFICLFLIILLLVAQHRAKDSLNESQKLTPDEEDAFLGFSSGEMYRRVQNLSADANPPEIEDLDKKLGDTAGTEEDKAAAKETEAKAEDNKASAEETEAVTEEKEAVAGEAGSAEPDGAAKNEKA